MAQNAFPQKYVLRFSDLPANGSDLEYCTLENLKRFKWNGSQWVEVGQLKVLGF